MLVRSGILTSAEGEAAVVENVNSKGPVVLVCEHASFLLPISAGTLGLSSDALSSHIAWDPGALALSRLLSVKLDAVLVHQRFSRLLYDCNRPPESLAAMPEKSEIFEIPGNKGLSVAERYARTAAVYIPFHDRISAELARRDGQGRRTVFITVHSFTPIYFGQAREVEIGILHDTDSRLADAMLAGASASGPFRVVRNAPYGPEDGVTHTLRLHALPAGYANVMLEVRNDLIANSVDQEVMADYLAGLIANAVSSVGGH